MQRQQLLLLLQQQQQKQQPVVQAQMRQLGAGGETEGKYFRREMSLAVYEIRVSDGTYVGLNSLKKI